MDQTIAFLLISFVFLHFIIAIVIMFIYFIVLYVVNIFTDLKDYSFNFLSK